MVYMMSYIVRWKISYYLQLKRAMPKGKRPKTKIIINKLINKGMGSSRWVIWQNEVGRRKVWWVSVNKANKGHTRRGKRRSWEDLGFLQSEFLSAGILIRTVGWDLGRISCNCTLFSTNVSFLFLFLFLLY